MCLSRSVFAVPSDALSSLTGRELNIAIAREVLGWQHISCTKEGRIQNLRPKMLTTVAPTSPDWLNYDHAIVRREYIVRRRGWWAAYHRELGKIAGDFNPQPTRRQRCEAAVSTARLSPMDR